jgi:hypothetical protein
MLCHSSDQREGCADTLAGWAEASGSSNLSVPNLEASRAYYDARMTNRARNVDACSMMRTVLHRSLSTASCIGRTSPGAMIRGHLNPFAA